MPFVQARIIASGFSRAAAAAGPSIRAFLSVATAAESPSSAPTGGPAQGCGRSHICPETQAPPDAKRARVSAPRQPSRSEGGFSTGGPATKAVSAGVQTLEPTETCAMATQLERLAQARSTERESELSFGLTEGGQEFPACNSEQTGGIAEIDLAAIDVAEQRRILQQLTATRTVSATSSGGGNPNKRGSGATSGGLARRGGGVVPQRAKGRQPGIAELFKRAG